MIAVLAGEVAVRRGDHVVVSCGGVGYRLAVSAETLRHVPAAGHELTIHTHLIVRDDALQLYGFATEEERDLFLLLLGVLSGGAPRDLTAALAAGDTAFFRAVPGIGKRTAERIVVELREKVEAPEIVISRGGDGPHGEARAGLLDLGYPPAEAEELLRSAEGDTVEALIQSALRLARR